MEDYKYTRSNSSDLIPTDDTDWKYEYIKKIGKGRFGRIYLILNKTNKSFHVVKHIKKKYTKNVQNEINILEKIQNKSDYLLNMSNHYLLANKDIMILTEYIHNAKDMNDFIHQKSLRDSQYLQIIQELLLGLKVLHELDIVHMDIKPKNILIYKSKNNYKIKYIDFGFACHKDDKNNLSRYRGTAQYMDPYMIERKIDNFHQSKKADIWSLGVTIYKLVHRELPWISVEKDDIKNEIKNTEFVLSKNKTFSLIIDNMIQKSIRKRHSLDKLLSYLPQLQESCQK